MTFDFSLAPCALDGTTFMRGDKPFTLSEIAVDALLSDPKRTDGDWQHKSALFNLATKIAYQSEVNLNDDEIKMIKQKVGELYPAGLVGPVCVMLDNPKAQTVEAEPSNA